MRKIYFITLLSLVFPLFANAEDTLLTSDQVVRAVGRLIVDQDKVKDKQYKLNRTIVDLKKRLKRLEKGNGKIDNSNQAEYMTAVAVTNSNIRKKPTTLSQKIGFTSMCSIVHVKKCVYSNGSIWCQVKNGGYINKYLLSFDKIKFIPQKGYKYYREPNSNEKFLIKEPYFFNKILINGISLHGKWSCLSNGYYLKNSKLKKSIK